MASSSYARLIALLSLQKTTFTSSRSGFESRDSGTHLSILPRVFVFKITDMGRCITADCKTLGTEFPFIPPMFIQTTTFGSLSHLFRYACREVRHLQAAAM